MSATAATSATGSVPRKWNRSRGSCPPGEWKPIGTTAPQLAGEYYLVTGSGKYFRNVMAKPEDTLCILAFGLIHTMEKSAEILVKVRSMSSIKLQTIQPDDFQHLEKSFNVELPEKILYVKH